MNEEEVKVKYILPWLADAGIDLRQLQFEQSFSIRIGRQTVPVGGAPARRQAGGRLDILVRAGQKNLLIVETKGSEIPLTNDDRDQAISYARLVHPIAPYAVVTNGADYRIYDAVSKEVVDPSQIRLRGFEAALPVADVEEAQRIFLALSPQNLLAFCTSQVANELRVIKGTVDEARKYIPELHVPRTEVLRGVNDFLGSPLPGLFLVGPSGYGKTCELCWIAESLLANDKPVLFFNGFALERDILDAIAREFLWTFNGPDVPIQIVKRLQSFVGENVLTIIVDAIDEWTFPSRSNHLASLLAAAEKQKLKILVTCKTSVVPEFFSNRGNPTIASLLSKRIDLPPLTPKEFYEAIEKYRQAYDFEGAFEDSVLDEARNNPFLLRVLFDVARHSRARHLTFGSAEFFRTYYERSINKMSDPHEASATLDAIANLLYERNRDSVLERDVRAALQLRINERLPEELFEHKVLLRRGDDSGTAAIEFYFQ